MAIAEMQKLNLVAMSYDRDKILNALQKTGAIEVKFHAEAESTQPLAVDCAHLSDYLNRTESALNFLCAETDAYIKNHKIKTDVLRDGFSVSYSEFRNASEYRATADETAETIRTLVDRRRELVAEQSRLVRTLESAKIYSVIKQPFNEYSNTRHATVSLGTVPVAQKENFIKAAGEAELVACEILFADAENALVLIAAHKSANTDELLQTYGFVACPFGGEQSGEQIYCSAKERLDEIPALLEEIENEFYALSDKIRPLKIYCDYLGFELEKLTSAEKMRCTATTFLLEAYVPKEEESFVAESLENVTSAVYYEFSKPAEDELPPTLYKNNSIVRNFETITNMYSPANSREFDPNVIMWLFYSIFLGFIMADIGYGLIMLLGGGLIYYKNRSVESGLKRLSGVFAIGGVFTIVWGALFGSLFGFTIFHSVMPNPQNDMWGFMGIKVPAVLVICLEIGVVQLFAGYVCRTVQCWRRKQIADGILDGIVWAVFSVGVGLAIIGLLDEVNNSLLATVGGIAAGCALAVAIFTAGRKEKLLGKFTKGFGAAYSVINYASDILSYARLYGLMLSGAVIAQIVSDYSGQFIMSGNIGFIILAVVLMLVGHIFNLAIGLLGAYIHDARLQYVEFYGRFFEGEGELFTPLGSNHKFVRVVNHSAESIR